MYITGSDLTPKRVKNNASAAFAVRAWVDCVVKKISDTKPAMASSPGRIRSSDAMRLTVTEPTVPNPPMYIVAWSCPILSGSATHKARRGHA